MEVMSYIFDVGDETVWSPALRVGQTFAKTAECVASVIGYQTGLVAVANDMIEIDLPTFESFALRTFDEYCRSQNFVYRELIRGVLAPSLVMLQRAGLTVPAATEEQHTFIRELDQYARSMPT
jgi:hypothetical protein